MIKLILAALLTMAALSVFAKDPGLRQQTLCPVTGEKIVKNAYLDYQGQRIYFCCKGCISKFQAEPEKYMEKFEKDGILLENVQKKDPICNMEITDRKIKRDYKGRRVFFCSDYCAKEFDKDPKAALEKMSK
ncbi:MAG TPA: YHS domain-containing protein [Acidobacteriota bacterium]|nr:YHS domain-containing protein [Acidobacteriota bacterium]HNT18087.1 YHS domain-containing protein [Acidobacteriota bacterium]HPA27206.1 YHS domain-containing protein [Acidobacteriota bacterium]HQO19424.1 YHS domain-containing protein [Acidobacteriota bacterium]HQQ46138.1 YHS domain-containing protein [Acidobacteriota bacterium]